MKIAIYVLILFALGCTNENTVLNVENLRCEYLEDPIGIDLSHPGFSWMIKSEVSNTLQTAYQIQVLLTGKDSNRIIVWETDLIQSGNSANIPYEGENLISDTEYLWRVRIKDNHGKISSWSEFATFQTAFLKQDEFGASFISHPDEAVRVPFFRKNLLIKKPVKRATAYLAAIGYAELMINGHHADDYRLDPPASEYNVRTYYSAINITGQLIPGTNNLLLWLAEGHAAYKITQKDRFHTANRRSCFDNPAVKMQINIHYEDGSEEIVETDKTWKCTASPITYYNIFGGEDYDARLWNQAIFNSGYADSIWQNPIVFSYTGKLSCSKINPVKVMQTMQLVESIRTDDTTYIYDLGSTIAGWWKIKVSGDRGSTLRIRCSEAFGDSELPEKIRKGKYLNFDKNHGGNRYFRDNYNTYILAGNGIEEYEPLFYFHGFRYIQIEVSDPKVKIHNVEALHAYNAIPLVGEFSCSDNKLNVLHQNVVRTYQNNFNSFPLSNPHSEIFGWTGDVHLFCQSADYNLDMPAFWSKWIQDIHDGQVKLGQNGAIPEVVPNYRPMDYGAETAWAMVYPILIWQMFVNYNDTSIIKRHYQSVIDYCNSCTINAKNHIVNGYWGDHNHVTIQPDATFKSRSRSPEMLRLINTAYYYYCIQHLHKMAEVMGDKKKVNYCTSLSDSIQSAFNSVFFHSETTTYEEAKADGFYDNMHSSNLIPLQVGIVPEKYKQKVLDNVIQSITESYDGKFFTGILGTKALFEVLDREGKYELMYKLIKDERFPGWIYQVNLGATSLWQRWVGIGGDYNHAMFGGAVEEFFYENLLGIKTETIGSKRHVIINPFYPADMAFAQGQVNTIYGPVAVSWKKEKDQIILSMEIPANLEATVIIGNDSKKVGSGTYKFYRDIIPSEN